MESFLGYGRQCVDEDDISAVVEVLRSGFLTQGPVIERFEAALAERVGARHAVAVSSGTAALHLACLAAGLGQGGQGLTSALSFVASANSMAYTGAEPQFGDIDPKTLCLAPPTPAATDGGPWDVAMPVHFAGLATEVAGRYRAAAPVVIEDAAHALGGTYADGRPIGCGAHADMAVFSFHPVKTITTGEGGAVVTNHPDVADRIRRLRSHGIERDPGQWLTPPGCGPAVPRWYYEQRDLGYNYRITDLQAALGLSQLAKLDRFVARRREIARYYDAAFADLPFVTSLQADEAMRRRSALHLYVVHFDWDGLGLTREEMMIRLRAAGIGSQVHYIPIYRQPYYARRQGAEPDRFPNTDAYFKGCLSLPLFPAMTDEDAQRVVSTLRHIVERGAAA